MKKVVLMAFIVIFSCKEDKKLIKNAVSISIWKKEMLDDNSLLIELHFNNNSETNYLLPISSDYILT